MFHKHFFPALSGILWVLSNPLAAQQNENFVSALMQKSDGKTLCTKLLQNEIDRLHKQGGGTLHLPAGTYLSGTLFLKSHVHLELGPGSTLLGSRRIEDYDRQHPHLLYCHPCENVKLSGMGTINGQGRHFFDEDFTPEERPEPWLVFGEGKNLKIEGLSFIDAPAHVLSLDFCENVFVRHITIKNHPRSPNTDGIDIRDSRNVFISQCLIETGDDAICLKANKDTIENVVVSDCILKSDDAALKFGTGSETMVRHCRFEGINIVDTRYGIALFMLEGGTYRDCQFSHISISGKTRHKHSYPIFIDIDQKSPEYPMGNIDNISLRNMEIHSNGKILIGGQAEQYIGRIHMQNIVFFNPSPVDFSKASKPRGNKSYTDRVADIDLSPHSSSITIGYVKQLLFKDVEVISSEKGRAQSVYLEKVTEL